MLVHYSNEQIDIYQIETNILEKYNIDSVERLDAIAKKLSLAYESTMGGGASKKLANK